MLLTKEEFDFLTKMNKQAIKRHREGKTKNVCACDECVAEKMNKPHYCGICGVVSYPRLTKEGERCGVCDKLLPKKREKEKE